MGPRVKPRESQGQVMSVAEGIAKYSGSGLSWHKVGLFIYLDTYIST